MNQHDMDILEVLDVEDPHHGIFEELFADSVLDVLRKYIGLDDTDPDNGAPFYLDDIYLKKGDVLELNLRIYANARDEEESIGGQSVDDGGFVSEIAESYQEIVEDLTNMFKTAVSVDHLDDVGYNTVDYVITFSSLKLIPTCRYYRDDMSGYPGTLTNEIHIKVVLVESDVSHYKPGNRGARRAEGDYMCRSSAQTETIRKFAHEIGIESEGMTRDELCAAISDHLK